MRSTNAYLDTVQTSDALHSRHNNQVPESALIPMPTRHFQWKTGRVKVCVVRDAMEVYIQGFVSNFAPPDQHQPPQSED